MKASSVEFIQGLAYARLEQLHAGDEETPVQKGYGTSARKDKQDQQTW